MTGVDQVERKNTQKNPCTQTAKRIIIKKKIKQKNRE